MCRVKKFITTGELEDYINYQGIAQNQIVNIIYHPTNHEYILIYFT